MKPIHDYFRRDIPHLEKSIIFRPKLILPEANLLGSPDAAVLCEYFLRFKPVGAAGNQTKIFGDRISLASLEELDAFMEEVNCIKDPEGRGEWTASSEYNPSVVPTATEDELDESLKRKLLAEVAEKKRITLEREQLDAENEAGTR